MFKWEYKYATGVKKFDDQHKQIIAFVNELYDAMAKGKGTEAIGGVLEGLINYTKTHFAEEEAAMQKYDYPYLDKHKREHAELVEKVLAFQGEFKAGKTFMAVQVMQFLRDWLTGHIMGTDKRYGSLLGTKDIK